MGGETLFVIKALEGEYDSREEFEDAREYVIQGWENGYTRDKGDGKQYSSITLMKSGTRHLIDSLNEALQFEENRHGINEMSDLRSSSHESQER